MQVPFSRVLRVRPTQMQREYPRQLLENEAPKGQEDGENQPASVPQMLSDKVRGWHGASACCFLVAETPFHLPTALIVLTCSVGEQEQCALSPLATLVFPQAIA